MKRIIKLIIAFWMMCVVAQAQCYIRLADASGMEASASELAALEAASCKLKAELPIEIRDSFTVVDVGFYLHHGVMENEFTEFLKIIENELSADFKTKYYVLFGRQSDDKGPNNHILVKVKLSKFKDLVLTNEHQLQIANNIATAANLPNNAYVGELEGLKNFNLLAEQVQFFELIPFANPATRLSKGYGLTETGKVILKFPTNNDSYNFYAIVNTHINTQYVVTGISRYSKHFMTEIGTNETLDKIYMFTDPNDVLELEQQGMVLQLEDATLPIFKQLSNSNCLYLYQYIDWKKEYNVADIDKYISINWEKPKNVHGANCLFDATNYTYCNDPIGVNDVAENFKKNYAGNNGSLESLIIEINASCPDGLTAIPYSTIKELFKRLCIQAYISEQSEIAILKLMQAIKKSDPNLDKANYIDFINYLNSTFVFGNESKPIITHLLKEMNDKTLGFWGSNSKTNFIGAIVMMYNEPACSEAIANLNPNITSTDAAIIVKNTFHIGHNWGGDTYGNYPSSTFREQSYDFFYGAYNEKSFHVYINYRKIAKTTYNSGAINAGSTLIYNTSSSNETIMEDAYIGEYNPLTPIILDKSHKLNVINNALNSAQEELNAITSGAKSSTALLVPAIFFDHFRDKYQDAQTRQAIFATLDAFTLLVPIAAPKILLSLTTAQKIWATAEIVGATTDLGINVNVIDANSGLATTSNLVNGLVGIKNAPAAIKGIGSFIKNVPSATLNIFASSKNCLTSAFGSGKSFVQYLQEISVNIKVGTANAQEKAWLNWVRYLAAFDNAAFELKLYTKYAKLLAKYNTLDEAQKLEFFFDFCNASHAELQALDNEVILIDVWKALINTPHRKNAAWVNRVKSWLNEGATLSHSNGRTVLQKAGVEVAEIKNGQLLPTKYESTGTAVGDVTDGYQVVKNGNTWGVKRVPDTAPYSPSELAELTQHPDAHVLERHGHDVSTEALNKRATSGVAPDGSTTFSGNPPSHSSKFGTHKRLKDALSQHPKPGMTGFNPPTTGNSYSFDFPPTGQDLTPFGFGIPSGGGSPIPMHRVKVVYKKDGGTWKILTMYPQL